MRNDWTDYLMHRAHKYVAKIGSGAAAKYFYTIDELNAFRKGKNKTAKPAKPMKAKKSAKVSEAEMMSKAVKKDSKKNKAAIKKIKALKAKKKAAKKKKLEKLRKKGAVNTLGLSKKERKAALDIWNKGKYGNGAERVKNLKKAGLNPKRVQRYLNAASKVGWNFKKLDKKISLEPSKSKSTKSGGSSKASKMTKSRVSKAAKRSVTKRRKKKNNSVVTKNVSGEERIYKPGSTSKSINSSLKSRAVKKGVPKSKASSKKKRKKTTKSTAKRAIVNKATLKKKATSGEATVAKLLEGYKR